MTNLPNFSKKDWSDSLNPVMLKELRQGLRSFEFLRAFYGMHLILAILMLVAVVIGPDQDQQGVYAFSWATIIFCLFQAPGRNAALITSERKANTLDLLLTTGLGPRRILRGKWAAAIAITALFAISLAPYPILHFVLSGGDVLSDVAAMASLVILSCPVQAVSLVFSSLNGFWVRHFFLAFIVISTLGIISLSVWLMSLLGLRFDFYGFAYLMVCNLIGSTLLTAVTLCLHGSMLSGPNVEKHKLAFAVPEFFKVRSKLDWDDQFNPFMVKELRQRLRSGQYPILLILFQIMILFLSIFQPNESFLIVISLIFFLLIPVREVGPVERERKENTLEPIMFTAITGKDVVSGLWATSIAEGLFLSLALLPGLILQAIFRGEDLIWSLEIFIAVNSVYGPLVAVGTGLALENGWFLLLFGPVLIFGIPAALVAVGLNTPSHLQTDGILFLVDVVLWFISVVATKWILSRQWVIEAKQGRLRLFM